MADLACPSGQVRYEMRMTSTPDLAKQPEAENLTRSERLDRLPFTRRHGKLVMGSGMGWALDAMDVGLVSFVMAALAEEWGLTKGDLSWVASVGFIGMAIGATLAGWLADRIGRRGVFVATLVVYGIATGASALAPSLAVLLILRFIVGLGLGGELPVASTLVSEYAPARIRGRIVVALEAFWALGWLFAALIAFFIVAKVDDGWRWAFAIGAIPALYAAMVRWTVPESVRFLELKGRHAEAERAVREFESSAGIPAPRQPRDTEHSTVRAGVGELFDRELRVRTVAIWAIWLLVNFAYYGAFIWLPSLLSAIPGFTLTKSFEYTLWITLAQLPGYAVAAFLIERWGRRPTLATFLAGSAVAAGVFALADTNGTVLAAGCLLSFFALGAWGAVYAVTPELYPTALRATGSGSAAGFGRIASIIAPLSVPWILGWGGNNTTLFIVFGSAYVLAAIAALALPELQGKRLRD